MTDKNDQPEFSRPVTLSDLAPTPTTLAIEANEDECAALARRFQLVDLSRLAARVTLSWEEGSPATLAVSGSLSADVQQRCVVSLQAFEETLADSFTERYRQDPGGASLPEAVVPEDSMDSERAESSGATLVLDTDELDVGEIIAQHLALALDPHPRAPGVSFDGYSDPEAEPTSPFAGLDKLLRH